MTPIEKLGHYQPNPDYGRGAARRRMHFRDDGHRLVARLFDSFHDMMVELEHDRETVLAAGGAMNRFPKTTCPGAVTQLSQLVGARISDGRRGVMRLADRQLHCTHLLDLGAFGVSMLQQGARERLLEIAVTDRDDERRQSVEVNLDGVHALTLVLRNEVIEAPSIAAEIPLFGGFGRWIADHFSGAEADVWLAAQMTVLVAQGRAFVTDGPDPRPVSEGLHRKGACFSFSEPQFSVGWDNIGTVLDLTEGLPPFSGT